METTLNTPITGWTRLYHPAGVQVTIPIPLDVPIGADAAQAAEFAALESSHGVRATWFLQTSVDPEDQESPFFDARLHQLATAQNKPLQDLVAELLEKGLTSATG